MSVLSSHPLHTPVRELFHRKGLRCTRQREVLYQALRATKSHPTADELLESLAGESSGMSLATVYNTLDCLESAGLVRRLPSRRGNAPARYDADIQSHVHVSTNDGRVLDVPAEISSKIMKAIPESLLDEVAKATGVRVSGVHVEILEDPG